MSGIYLLLTIVKRSDAAEYASFYKNHGISVTYSVNCNGTAHEKTLSILGIETTEKAMLFSVVTQRTLKLLKKRLTVDMKIDLPNRGVAMAIPLSGIGGKRTLEYFTAGQYTEADNMEKTRKPCKKQRISTACY